MDPSVPFYRGHVLAAGFPRLLLLCLVVYDLPNDKGVQYALDDAAQDELEGL